MRFLVFACSFFIAGLGAELIGFGISAVLMSLLPLILPLTITIPLVAVISVIATGIVAIKTKTRELSKYLIPLFIGSLIGIPLGIWFLGLVSKKALSVSLGTILIIYVIYNLISDKQELKLGKLDRFLLGITAGFFGASFNINGPLIGLSTLSNKSFSKHKNKDLVATYMSITGFFIVVGHVVSGRITTSILIYSLYALPFLIFGIWAGTKLYKKISLEGIKLIIYLLVSLAGIRFILP